MRTHTYQLSKYLIFPLSINNFPLLKTGLFYTVFKLFSLSWDLFILMTFKWSPSTSFHLCFQFPPSFQGFILLGILVQLSAEAQCSVSEVKHSISKMIPSIKTTPTQTISAHRPAFVNVYTMSPVRYSTRLQLTDFPVSNPLPILPILFNITNSSSCMSKKHTRLLFFL